MSNFSYEKLIESQGKIDLIVDGQTMFHTIRCHPNFVKVLEREFGTANLESPIMGGIKVIPSAHVPKDHIMMVGAPDKPGEPDRVVIYNLGDSEIQFDKTWEIET